MSEIGSSEPEENGMKTTITVVDGANGLTPDMLRHRTGAERYFAERAKYPEFQEAYWYHRDRMHD